MSTVRPVIGINLKTGPFGLPEEFRVIVEKNGRAKVYRIRAAKLAV